MQPLDPFFITEVILKIILSIVCLICGTFIILKGTREDQSGKKKFFFGLGAFGYLYCLCRTGFLISDFFSYGSVQYLILWRIAAISVLTAFFFLLLILETYVVKTKYIFTAIVVIGTILVAVLAIDLARIFSSITGLIVIVVVFSIYVYMAKNSEKLQRSLSIQFAVSIALMGIGHLIDGLYFQQLLGFDTGIIGTLLMIIGIIYYFKLNY